MANVTSNHYGPLSLPDGTVIPPNRTVHCEKWAVVSNNPTVKSWVDAGVLSVEQDEVVGGSEDEAKDALIARLATFGIAKNKRSSVASLQEALDAAEKAAAEKAEAEKAAAGSGEASEDGDDASGDGSDEAAEDEDENDEDDFVGD